MTAPTDDLVRRLRHSGKPVGAGDGNTFTPFARAREVALEAANRIEADAAELSRLQARVKELEEENAVLKISVVAEPIYIGIDMAAGSSKTAYAKRVGDRFVQITEAEYLAMISAAPPQP